MGSAKGCTGPVSAGSGAVWRQSDLVRTKDALPISIYSVVFGDNYEYMLNALLRSLQKNYPWAPFTVTHTFRPPEKKWLPRFITDNDLKLDLWAEHIDRQPDGSLVVLIDIDTLVLKPLDDAFRDDFDIGYTTRTGRVWLNAGVVFVRVNERSKKFCRAWAKINNKIVKMGSMALAHLAEFAGANQKALNDILIESKEWPDPPKTKEFPCAIWNCEQDSYAKFDPEKTVILHVKSWLREGLLHNAPSEKIGEAERALMPLCQAYGY